MPVFLARLSRLHPAWQVVIWSIAVVAIINPIRETAVSDDWSYARMVQTLLSVGSPQTDSWVAANPLVQIQWGALFSHVLGFSNSTLRISTLVLSALALCSFYFLSRDHGLGRREAAVLTLVMLSSPLFLHLSFTFMTDVPFLAFLLLAVFLYGRGLRTNDPALIALASLAGAAAVLTRQFGAVLLPAIFLAGMRASNSRARAKVIILGSLMPALATGYQVWLGTASPNWTAERLTHDQQQHLLSSAFVGEALWRPGITLVYLALFALPLAFPLIRRLITDRRPYRIETVCGLVIVVTICVGAVAFGRPALLPLLPWNLEAITRLPGRLDIALTAATIVGATLLSGCIWRRYSDSRLRPQSASEWVLDATSIAYFLSQISFVQFGDEYLLPLLPYVLIVTARDLWMDRPASVDLRIVRVFAVSILLVTALYERGFLSVNEARWRGALIASQLGQAPEAVSSSWEWDSYNGSFDRFIASGTGDSNSPSLTVVLDDFFFRWLPQANERALYLSVPLDAPPVNSPSLRVLATVPYRDALLRPKNVYVLSRPAFELVSCSGGYPSESSGDKWWRWTPDRIRCTFDSRPGLPVSGFIAFDYWSPAAPREVLLEVAGRSTRVSLLSSTRHTFRSERMTIRDNPVVIEIRLADGSAPNRLSETDPRLASFLIEDLRIEVAR